MNMSCHILDLAAWMDFYSLPVKREFLKFQGDSGGPLHVITSDGRYKQVGITSFGLVFGCELGLHAAFTRTSKHFSIKSGTPWQRSLIKLSNKQPMAFTNDHSYLLFSSLLSSIH